MTKTEYDKPLGHFEAIAKPRGVCPFGFSKMGGEEADKNIQSLAWGLGALLEYPFSGEGVEAYIGERTNHPSFFDQGDHFSRGIDHPKAQDLTPVTKACGELHATIRKAADSIGGMLDETQLSQPTLDLISAYDAVIKNYSEQVRATADPKNGILPSYERLPYEYTVNVQRQMEHLTDKLKHSELMTAARIALKNEAGETFWINNERKIDLIDTPDTSPGLYLFALKRAVVAQVDKNKVPAGAKDFLKKVMSSGTDVPLGWEILAEDPALKHEMQKIFERTFVKMVQTVHKNAHAFQMGHLLLGMDSQRNGDVMTQLFTKSHLTAFPAALDAKDAAALLESVTVNAELGTLQAEEKSKLQQAAQQVKSGQPVTALLQDELLAIIGRVADVQERSGEYFAQANMLLRDYMARTHSVNDSFTTMIKTGSGQAATATRGGV